MEIKKFIDSLISLRIILEEIEKINVIEKLEIMKTEEITKELKELEIDELEELERSLKFLALKNRFWGRSNNLREESRLREITRNKINEIVKSKIEIKRLKIKTIELKSSKLLTDLNM